MSIITVSMDLDPSKANFVNDPTDAFPIPQVVYANYGWSVDNNTSYSPPLDWSGMSFGSLPLPIPGPNTLFFLCGGFTTPLRPLLPILNITPGANKMIGSVNILFNATGNMSNGNLYYLRVFQDIISSWPGGVVESITVNISGATFTGDPIYGILSDDVLSIPPYTCQIFIINDPEIAGQTTATYTGDGTLYFPPASPLYITFMGGFTPSPAGSTITINGISGSSFSSTSAYIFGLVNIQGPCLHGGSLVSTLDGPKRMDQITIQDQVLTSSGQYATIKEVCQCWLSPGNGSNTYQALVIEPDALAPGIPDVRTILDPGHPIGVNSKSLNPAGSYAEGNDKISYALWGDTSLSSDPKLTRYDLVLEEPYRDYMVHNLVVQSRKSAKEAGYDHWYQEHY